jgi:gamma-glutamyltranspeptidase
MTQMGTLYNSPPPTQGLASLMILALFDRLRVAQADGFEHIHGLVEVTKRAFNVRDRVVTDPDKIVAISIDTCRRHLLMRKQQRSILASRALARALRRR